VPDLFYRLARRLKDPGPELIWPNTPSRFEPAPELGLDSPPGSARQPAERGLPAEAPPNPRRRRSRSVAPGDSTAQASPFARRRDAIDAEWIGVEQGESRALAGAEPNAASTMPGDQTQHSTEPQQGPSTPSPSDDANEPAQHQKDARSSPAPPAPTPTAADEAPQLTRADTAPPATTADTTPPAASAHVPAESDGRMDSASHPPGKSTRRVRGVEPPQHPQHEVTGPAHSASVSPAPTAQEAQRPKSRQRPQAGSTDLTVAHSAEAPAAHSISPRPINTSAPPNDIVTQASGPHVESEPAGGAAEPPVASPGGADTHSRPQAGRPGGHPAHGPARNPPFTPDGVTISPAGPFTREPSPEAPPHEGPPSDAAGIAPSGRLPGLDVSQRTAAPAADASALREGSSQPAGGEDQVADSTPTRAVTPKTAKGPPSDAHADGRPSDSHADSRPSDGRAEGAPTDARADIPSSDTQAHHQSSQTSTDGQPSVQRADRWRSRAHTESRPSDTRADVAASDAYTDGLPSDTPADQAPRYAHTDGQARHARADDQPGHVHADRPGQVHARADAGRARAEGQLVHTHTEGADRPSRAGERPPSVHARDAAHVAPTTPASERATRRRRATAGRPLPPAEQTDRAPTPRSPAHPTDAGNEPLAGSIARRNDQAASPAPPTQQAADGAPGVGVERNDPLLPSPTDAVRSRPAGLKRLLIAAQERSQQADLAASSTPWAPSARADGATTPTRTRRRAWQLQAQAGGEGPRTPEASLEPPTIDVTVEIGTLEIVGAGEPPAPARPPVPLHDYLRRRAGA
jgi:hypothetical protein